MADDGKKKRGLTPSEKLLARKAYEEEHPAPSMAELSRRFHVKRETLAKYRDDPTQPGGPWIPQVGGGHSPHGVDRPTEVAAAKTLASVTDIATKRALASMQADGTIEKIANSTRTAMELAARIEVEALETALRDLKRARIPLSKTEGVKDEETGETLYPLRVGAHTSEAGEHKDVIAAANTASDLSRTMRGLRPGTASIDETNKARKFRRFVLTTPAEVKAEEERKAAGGEAS